MSNGVFGSLIVRQADARDPHRALYDVDDPEHVVLLTQWSQQQASGLSAKSKGSLILVNGKGRHPDGPQVPLTAYTVTPGRRHRFRVANAGGAGSCPVTLAVDSHTLLLITLDGHPVNPQNVTSITLAKGARKVDLS